MRPRILIYKTNKRHVLYSTVHLYLEPIRFHVVDAIQGPAYRVQPPDVEPKLHAYSVRGPKGPFGGAHTFKGFAAVATATIFPTLAS